MISRFTLNFCINFILYVALFASFNLNKNIFNTAGVLSQKLNLSEYVMSRSQIIISKLKNQNLAVNFLANQRTLSDTEKISFQSSGLVHLLAVSGAQIIPVCQLLSLVVMQLIYILLRSYMPSTVLMKLLFYLKNCVVISISFLMTGLFSCAGALVRVTFLSSINEFFKSQSWLYPVSRLLPFLSESFVRRFVLIFFVSLLFGNVFFDYSFLLSAIGAITLEITSISLHYACKKLQMPKKLRVWTQPLLLCLLTSFFVTLLLYPVSRVSFILSSLSNVVAAPVVTFIITPLSLFLIAGGQNIVLNPWILKLFDGSLEILNFIAETFQDPNYSLEMPKILLFSVEGKFYLILLLIVLFSISDAIRARDAEYLRHRLRVQ